MAAKKMAVKTLDLEFSVGRQDVICTVLAQMGEHKLRLRLRSDSYKFQCHAYAEVLQKADGIKWERLVSIDHSNMATPEGLCYNIEMQRIRGEATSLQIQDAVGRHFMLDRAELLRKAALLLA